MIFTTVYQRLRGKKADHFTTLPQGIFEALVEFLIDMSNP